MKSAVQRMLLLLIPLLAVVSCDREADIDDVPAAAPGADSTSVDSDDGETAGRPAEIYFDLTRFDWYREGQPLVHDGRSYMPQSDPTKVDLELEEGGTYQGLTYYMAKDATEPVYTLYVPVYYRYWQRFTAPPGR